MTAKRPRLATPMIERLQVVEVDARSSRHNKSETRIKRPAPRDDIDLLVVDMMYQARAARQRMEAAVESVAKILSSEDGDRARERFRRASQVPPNGDSTIPPPQL